MELVASWTARSPALLGFGGDSVIELFSAIIVLWRFRSKPDSAVAEKSAARVAGGLVFAADLGGQIYAMDAETGEILWQTDAGQSTGGGFVTYRAGGRQLIGVASGMKSPMWPGGAQQSRILVYGLR